MFQWLGNGVTAIANRLGYWGPVAPTSERDPSPDREDPPGEKMKAGPRIPYFLPYYDQEQNVGETQLMRMAYRRMLSDPHVKAALLGKIVTVMGQELKVLPANKKNIRDTLIADFTQWCLTDRFNGGLPMMVWSILSGGLIDGFSVCEKVWEIEEEGTWKGKEVLADLKPKDVNQDLVLNVDPFKNIESIMGLRYNGGQTFNPEDFVIFTFMPLYGTPTGMSDLRSCYRAYWFIDTVTKLRALGAEKRALPVVAGEYPDPTKMNGVIKALSTLKSGNWIAVPKDVQLKVLELAGSSEDYFKSFRADLVEEIFLAIQGATLQALAGQSGVNVGRSTTHESTSDLFKSVLVMFIANVLNNHKRGLIRDIVSRNFVAVQTYPKGSFEKIDKESLKGDMEMYERAQRMGYPLSFEDFGEKFAIKRGVGEDAMTMPGMPAGQPGQAAPDAPQPGGDGADELDQLFGPGNNPFADQGGGEKENEPDAEGFSEWIELPDDLFEGVFS